MRSACARRTSRTLRRPVADPAPPARHPGWHRTGDVGHLDDAGRLWVEGRLAHVVRTADGVVTRSGWSSASRAWGSSTPPRRSGSVPPAPSSSWSWWCRGARARAAPDRVGPRPATRRRGPDGRRPGRGRVPVAAVLRAARCRWTSGTPRRSTAEVAARPTACSPAPTVRAAREGPGHRRLGAAGRDVARTLAARGDEVTVMQRRASGLGLREVRGDVADPARRCGPRRARTPWCTWPRRSTSWDRRRTSSAPTSSAPAASSRPAGRSACPGWCRCRSPSVAHAGHALVGVGAGPADPGRARGHYARTKRPPSSSRSPRTPRTWPSWPCGPTWCGGPGDTQLVGRLVARAPRRSAAVIAVGLGADRHHLRRRRRRRDRRRRGRLRARGAHGEALVVSGGEPRTVREILERVCAAAGARRRACACPCPSPAPRGRRSTRSGRPPVVRTRRR